MTEQEKDTDLWLKNFYDGKCSLADLIFFTLQSGAPANQQIFDLYARALSKYDAGGDIEELLGLIRVKPKTQEKFKKESNVIHAVKDSKKPKNDPLNYDGTAFHEAGEIVCLAPSTVYDIYKKRRKK